MIAIESFCVILMENRPCGNFSYLFFNSIQRFLYRDLFHAFIIRALMRFARMAWQPFRYYSMIFTPWTPFFFIRGAKQGNHRYSHSRSHVHGTRVHAEIQVCRTINREILTQIRDTAEIQSAERTHLFNFMVQPFIAFCSSINEARLIFLLQDLHNCGETLQGPLFGGETGRRMNDDLQIICLPTSVEKQRVNLLVSVDRRP